MPRQMHRSWFMILLLLAGATAAVAQTSMYEIIQGSSGGNNGGNNGGNSATGSTQRAAASGRVPFDAAFQASEVRRVYQILADYAAADPASKDKLSFSLADFRSIAPSRFGKQRMVDALTMPGGDVIDAMPIHRQIAAAGKATTSVVTFQVEWSHMDHSWLESEEGKHNQGHTLQDLLAELVDGNPGFHAESVIAATSYQVQATLGGKQRTYRAVFFWLSPQAVDFGVAGRYGTRFIVVDHLTSGIAEAAMVPAQSSAQLHLASPKAALQAAVTGPGGVTPTPGTTGPCNSSYYGNYFTLTAPLQSNTVNHFSGQHQLQPTVSFTCSCDEDCNNVASPVIQGSPAPCAESGLVTGACHQPGQSSSVAQVVSVYPKSLTTGGTAGVSYICSMRACADCNCTVSVATKAGISAGIDGFTGTLETTSTYTPDPNAFWSANWSLGYECPPCTASPAPCTDGCNCPGQECQPGYQCVGHPGICQLCGTGHACADLNYHCGTATECGQSETCLPCDESKHQVCVITSDGSMCEGGQACFPCDNQTPDGCGTFWSTSCQEYATCPCLDPTLTCVQGSCVLPTGGGGGEGGGGTGGGVDCSPGSFVSAEQCNYCLGVIVGAYCELQ
jgi:hypothetical protein